MPLHETASPARQNHHSRQELIERMARALPEDGLAEWFDRLRLRRASMPVGLGHGVTYPALCVIAQGAKEVGLGGRRYRFDPEDSLVVTAALPIASRVIQASPEQPYFGVVIRLDPELVDSVMVDMERPVPNRHVPARGLGASPLDGDLLDVVVRLVRLVEASADARILVPLVMREIAYRLLIGPQGDRLRSFAALGGSTHRIGEVIARLRREFDRPLRMEELAREAGMSLSGFHNHFKDVTAMSPLQFQKQLRLQEARRLMLGEGFDAASAGFQVGYRDASQFSREYKRLFGEPPLRDIARLRSSEPLSPGL